MNRSEIVRYGVLVGIIAALIGSLWDPVSTMLIENFVVAAYGYNPIYYPLLGFLGMNRMDLWMLVWNITFSGSIYRGVVVNVFAIVAVGYFLSTYKPKGISKLSLTPILLFAWTGMCMIFNCAEDWVGIWWRNTLGFDLMFYNYDIYGFIAPIPMAMPYSIIFNLWIPAWTYVVSRIGEGLLLLTFAFILLSLHKHGFKLSSEMKSNLLLVGVSTLMIILPKFFVIVGGI